MVASISSTLMVMGGCGSEVALVSCYWELAGLIPMSAMLKSPGARYWISDPSSVVVATLHGSHYHKCINDCKSVWTKAFTQCPSCKCNKPVRQQPQLPFFSRFETDHTTRLEAIIAFLKLQQLNYPSTRRLWEPSGRPRRTQHLAQTTSVAVSCDAVQSSWGCDALHSGPHPWEELS